MSYGDFLHVGKGGSVERWLKRPLGDLGGRNEAWLRDLLHDEPGLVPIRDIDASYGPLISVCKELKTPAGRIDNVFIDRTGRLTLIECKLWNNPESRRKVVAQILDYAKELSRWSYADLQREVSARTAGSGSRLFELVSAVNQDLVEHQFADAVTKALRNGRFLLLIAGDGIREDVSLIAELINRNVTSGFSFGMFEVGIYVGPNDELLVQPRSLIRTRIVERTVVLLENNGVSALRDLDEEEEEEEEETRAHGADVARKIHADAEAWWRPVLAVPLDDPEQPPFKYRWPNHIRGALPWPGTWIMAYRSAKSGATIGVFLRGRVGPLAELLGALRPDAAAILMALPAGTLLNDERGLGIEKRWDAFQDDDQRYRWLGSTINVFTNELRPRIEKLLG